MDSTKAIALVLIGVAVLVVLTFGIAALVGGNERGNDDHELDQDEEQRRG